MLQTPPADLDPSTSRFEFKGRGLEVEFEGQEPFVSAQIAHLKDALVRALAATSAAPAPAAAPAPGAASAPGVAGVPGVPGVPGAVAAPASGVARAAAESAALPGRAANDVAGRPGLEEFYRRAKSRDGRGALQETILIFAYFLREYRSKEEFSIENLNACFSLVGATPPKSLANTLGIMKRNQRFFQSGSRRGMYQLTDKGVGYVKRLIGTA
jgi:hypothetical protein